MKATFKLTSGKEVLVQFNQTGNVKMIAALLRMTAETIEKEHTPPPTGPINR